MAARERVVLVTPSRLMGVAELAEGAVGPRGPILAPLFARAEVFSGAAVVGVRRVSVGLPPGLRLGLRVVAVAGLCTTPPLPPLAELAELVPCFSFGPRATDEVGLGRERSDPRLLRG